MSTREHTAPMRMLEIAKLITDYPKQFTAKQLADRYSTSERTIRRDIERLERCSIRVESEPGGGYFIKNNLSRLPVALTPTEQLAMKMVPWIIKSTNGPNPLKDLHGAFLSAMEKLTAKSGVSPEVTDNAVSLSRRILADPTMTDAADDPELASNVVVLLQALAEQSTVEMDYYSFRSDSSTTRLMDPYYLIPKNNSLYVVGYCHAREEYRTFKVSRIQRIRSLNKGFQMENDFSLRQFLEDTWEIDQRGEPIEAILLFSQNTSKYVKEELKPSRIVEETTLADRSYRVKVRARLSPEFLRWVRQYGADVDVIGPDILRDEMVREAKRFLEKYQATAQRTL